MVEVLKVEYFDFYISLASNTTESKELKTSSCQGQRHCKFCLWFHAGHLWFKAAWVEGREPLQQEFPATMLNMIAS